MVGFRPYKLRDFVVASLKEKVDGNDGIDDAEIHEIIR